MNIYLTLAYTVFTLVPIGLWLSIMLRHKRLLRYLEENE
jgi:hypothetical protein